VIRGCSSGRGSALGRNLLTDEEWTVFAPFLTEAMPASGLWDVLLQALASTPGSRERCSHPLNCRFLHDERNPDVSEPRHARELSQRSGPCRLRSWVDGGRTAALIRLGPLGAAFSMAAALALTAAIAIFAPPLSSTQE
jgi:hypothetical protein